MDRQRVFLTAEWRDLAMLNYAVDPDLLQPLVPAGTELDAFDGVTYLSLIGFLFNRTALLGVPVPFHQSFEEVNVRFYVRRGLKRGVVFIRELVPKRAVAAVARAFFREQYSFAPMSHRIERNGDQEIFAEYAWGAGSKLASMKLHAEGCGYLPPEGSVSQFITEHYWGYAAQPDGGCLEYEVEHPRWRVRAAGKAAFAGNAIAHYGEGIASCLARMPDSAFLAEGSAVAVSKGIRIC